MYLDFNSLMRSLHAVADLGKSCADNPVIFSFGYSRGKEKP